MVQKNLKTQVVSQCGELLRLSLKLFLYSTHEWLNFLCLQKCLVANDVQYVKQNLKIQVEVETDQAVDH